MLDEPPIERCEHQDNAHVYRQPSSEAILEEQDVHADHNRDQREYVKHDGWRRSHDLKMAGGEGPFKHGRGGKSAAPRPRPAAPSGP
jgi:hypothetical protein